MPAVEGDEPKEDATHSTRTGQRGWAHRRTNQDAHGGNSRDRLREEPAPSSILKRVEEGYRVVWGKKTGSGATPTSKKLFDKVFFWNPLIKFIWIM